MAEEMEVTETGDPGLDAFQETVEEFLAAADVRVVYGEPIQHEDTIIIPTAEVLSVMGFGVGSGSGRDAHEDPEHPSGGSGSGGGGGGRVLARPVAVVIASPEGVRVEPVFDLTKIALAGLTAVGFMVGMVLRMSSRHHAIRAIEE